MNADDDMSRTPPKKKARELATHLRGEHPDCAYLRRVFQALRAELGVSVPGLSRRLPGVPSEEEIRWDYETVWQARPGPHLGLIKPVLDTGVRSRGRRETPLARAHP